ncbi:hypothetical protein ALC57_05630 [Trachymyrmex cornetzi]|uniref:Uncharacterized protein n=1 Tax=Trachymyrmex cornetzi TaxID=471704 RepID=A0A151JAI3_9HYME|nr:hypothetical protein ALC57_05630 [Trachymyrmex cornetzi]
MNQEATNRGSMSSPRKDLVLRTTMELAHPFLKTYRITAHYDAQSYGASLKNTRSRDIVFLKRACTLDQQRCSLTVIVLYMSSQCALLLTLFHLGSVPTSNCYQTFYKFTFSQEKQRFNPRVLTEDAKRCGEEEDEEDRPSWTITRRTKSRAARSANEHFFHAIPAARCYFPDEIERIDSGNERRTEV